MVWFDIRCSCSVMALQMLSPGALAHSLASAGPLPCRVLDRLASRLVSGAPAPGHTSPGEASRTSARGSRPPRVALRQLARLQYLSISGGSVDGAKGFVM